MATEPPPQSWLSRNAHIIVWVVVLLAAALGLSWSYIMPQTPTPQATQVNAPVRPTATLPSDQTAAQRTADEKATADKIADDRAWNDTTRAGTAAAFEAYIQNNPSGAYVADARARIVALAEQARREAEARATAERAAAERAAAEQKTNDDRAFAEAMQAGTTAALENYIRNNTVGAHIAEAQQRIATLTAQARQAAEAQAAAEREAARRAEDDRAWTTATQAGTVASFETYLRNNPSGARAGEAQQRIAALNEQTRREEEARVAAAKAAEERAWVEAAQAGTAAALEAYIRNHPSGARAADARERIAIINEQARRAAEERAAAERIATERAAAAAERTADDRAFAEATQTGTIEAYETYIRNKGSGAHVMEASQRLAQLRAAAEKKGTAKTATRATGTLKDRSRPYAPQKPVYKAPPMNAAMR